MKTKRLLMTTATLSLPAITWAADAGSNPPKILQPQGLEPWISFSPIILFLIILFATIFKLRKDQVKLSDLFEEKDKNCTSPSNGNNANQSANPNLPANTDPNNKPAQSVSRFIAFITGLTSLVIGVCITTFYMYCFFRNTPADLSNLSNVILGLGIGVLPYGFNKASAAIKS